MEFVEQVEAGVGIVVPLLKLTLEVTSMLCITIGLLTTARLAIVQFRRRGRSSFSFSSLRLRFGQWLALALEFQLGADVVATTITASFANLGKLAIIAVIRTFLNYFLEKELKQEAQIEGNKLNQNYSG